ncbi:MAG: phosphate ABC transporter substrate-binding protein, partial [Halobacteriaceae archaeon]
MMDSQPAFTRRHVLKASSLLGTIGLAGCMGSGNGSGKGLTGDINIAGSSTVYPIAVAITEEFKEQHPEVNISLSRT